MESEYLMQAWEAVEKTLVYIEEHLAEAIKAQDLAALAHLSVFYYQRLFRRLVGRSLQDYLKLRRLALASQQLLATDQQIIDVAVAAGFSSHAHFTKAFKWAYGLTPEGYRKEKPLLNQMLKPDLQLKHTVAVEGVPLLTEGMFLEISRQRLVQRETYLGYVGDLSIKAHIPVAGATGLSGPEPLWQRFHETKKDFPALVAGGVELGASFLRDKTRDPNSLGPQDVFNYFAGGASDGSRVPGLEEWCLEPGEYVVCRFEAEASGEARSAALSKSLAYLLGTWLPQQKLATLPFSVEKYYPLENGSCQIEIWVVPILRSES